jgi:YD repeat-containing protein
MKASKRGALAIVSAAILTLGISTARADDPQITHAEKHVHTTHTVYDAIGNVVVTTGSGTMSSAYDSSGTINTDTGTNGITYQYDALDRATTTTGGPTSYTYDQTGGDSETPHNGNAGASMGYNSSGASATDDDHVGNTITYQYDSLGRGITTDSNSGDGRTTTYDYDALNRQTGISGTDPLGNTTTYQYDSLNRRITETDAIGGVNNTDNTDTTSSGSVEMQFTTQYQYDALNRTTTTDAGSSMSVQLYDETTNTTVYQYDASDLDAPGRTTMYQYDPSGGVNMGTLQGSLEGDLLPGHVYRYSYQYDVNQNVTQTGSGDLSLTLNLTPLPEPGSIALIGLAAPWVIRRRR